MSPSNPLKLSGLLATALLAAASWATAAAASDQVFDDWALRCPDKVGCFLDQRVFIKGQEEQPLLQAAFQYRGTDRRPGGVLRVPLGVLLEPGLTLRIDAAKPYLLHFSHCRREGCVALFKVTPQLRRRLERGREAKVGFKTMEGRLVELPLSLMGITAGLAALADAPRPDSEPAD